MFNGLDHIAIVVPDTEQALKIWRDRFGFPVLFSEQIGDGSTLLTHLDLGNAHLQLVQPLKADHPLQRWLNEHGPGLHHFTLKVNVVPDAMDEMRSMGLDPGEPEPHEGTQGKDALFLSPACTGGIQIEVTGAKRAGRRSRSKAR